MARLVLRKSLNLFEEEDRKSSGSRNSGKTKESPADVEGLKKCLRNKKGKVKKRESKLKGSVQDLQMKCILDEVKKRKNMDLTEDNLSILLKSSGQNVVESISVDKIMNHQRGRLAKNSLPEEKKQSKDKSLFSEDDFDKFEKEYFVSS